MTVGDKHSISMGFEKGLGQHTDLRIGEVVGLRVCALKLSIGGTRTRLHVNGSWLRRDLGRMLEGWMDLWVIGARRALHAQGWGWIRRARRPVHWHGRIAGRDHMWLRDGRVRWETFWGHGVTGSEGRVGSRLPLVTDQGGDVGVDFESFAGAYLLQII